MTKPIDYAEIQKFLREVMPSRAAGDAARVHHHGR